MQFRCAVVANPNTKVEAHWYDTSPAEHAQLLAEAEAAGEVVMRPTTPAEGTWWCRPAGIGCGQPGNYNLIIHKDYGTAYVRFVAPNTEPTR